MDFKSVLEMLNEGVSVKTGDNVSGQGTECDKEGNTLTDKPMQVTGKVIKDRVMGEFSLMLVKASNGKLYVMDKSGAKKAGSLPGKAFF